MCSAPCATPVRGRVWGKHKEKAGEVRSGEGLAATAGGSYPGWEPELSEWRIGTGSPGFSPGGHKDSGSESHFQAFTSHQWPPGNGALLQRQSLPRSSSHSYPWEARTWEQKGHVHGPSSQEGNSGLIPGLPSDSHKQREACCVGGSLQIPLTLNGRPVEQSICGSPTPASALSLCRVWEALWTFSHKTLHKLDAWGCPHGNAINFSSGLQLGCPKI